MLSRDDVFADSLAGAPLVGDGPIFFTDTEQLHPQTRAELDRVPQPGGRVYLLGGTGAVSQAIEDELTAAGYEVARLSGPSRVETSVRIAQEVLALYPGDQVALARAGGPADNPTAAGVAVDAGAPLLPVDPAGASEAVFGQVKSDSEGVPIVDLLLFGDGSVIPLEVQQELDAQD